jgi:hypothetical protein
MNQLTKVSDLFWVLKAYSLGKIFNQKEYKPASIGDVTSFPKIPRENYSRRNRLIAWWGYRPVLHSQEAQTLADHGREWLKENCIYYEYPSQNSNIRDWNPIDKIAYVRK